jgi:hypothetical protein
MHPLQPQIIPMARMETRTTVVQQPQMRQRTQNVTQRQTTTTVASQINLNQVVGL